MRHAVPGYRQPRHANNVFQSKRSIVVRRPTRHSMRWVCACSFHQPWSSPAGDAVEATPQTEARVAALIGFTPQPLGASQRSIHLRTGLASRGSSKRENWNPLAIIDHVAECRYVVGPSRRRPSATAQSQQQGTAPPWLSRASSKRLPSLPVTDVPCQTLSRAATTSVFVTCYSQYLAVARGASAVF